ncbi:amidohydrolase family protein [Lacisediminimonas sp.]|uniref:amidohydrolase family protein n=1 Tax=Lacisediminimonas sp. TaxID=3060582 RepID=UPI00271D7691|nr:amidohydrolase family protein [Lacisediminimonas sp.]MDO8300596.1 amidohydrolase family protein [Lacisediminimonas sp.]
MKIIDFRVRPPLKSFVNCGFFNDTTAPFGWHSALPRSVGERSISELRKELQRAGVSGSVVWGRMTHDPKVSSTNDDVAAILHEHQDLFLAGFAGLCPAPAKIRESMDELERVMKMPGIKGITLEPGFGMRPMTSANDPILYPIYERLQEMNGILALTIARGSPREQTLTHADPEGVDRVAANFPDLKIVVSHAFWPWVEQSCGLAFRRPNVYLQPDLYGMGMPGYLHWVEAANSFLADRMIFGSAYPFLGVEAIVESYLQLPYRPSVMEKVMGGNALRLLGME